jgi:hypothetical protein
MEQYFACDLGSAREPRSHAGTRALRKAASSPGKHIFSPASECVWYPRVLNVTATIQSSLLQNCFGFCEDIHLFVLNLRGLLRRRHYILIKCLYS